MISKNTIWRMSPVFVIASPNHPTVWGGGGLIRFV